MTKIISLEYTLRTNLMDIYEKDISQNQELQKDIAETLVDDKLLNYHSIPQRDPSRNVSSDINLTILKIDYYLKEPVPDIITRIDEKLKSALSKVESQYKQMYLSSVKIRDRKIYDAEMNSSIIKKFLKEDNE
ncbi:MAG: hypothetical protein ACP5N1_01400 [Candidatus Woesearchaeota archaeon]